MRDVVVTDCVRTAVGKMNGSLSEYDEQELAALVMKEVLHRSRITADEVDEVIFGHVKMNTYPMDVARYGWLRRSCLTLFRAIRCTAPVPPAPSLFLTPARSLAAATQM